jgi:hypothetical protein
VKPLGVACAELAQWGRPWCSYRTLLGCGERKAAPHKKLSPGLRVSDDARVSLVACSSTAAGAWLPQAHCFPQPSWLQQTPVPKHDLSPRRLVGARGGVRLQGPGGGAPPPPPKNPPLKHTVSTAQLVAAYPHPKARASLVGQARHAPFACVTRALYNKPSSPRRTTLY